MNFPKKLFLWSFSLIGVMILTLGYLQFKKNINYPSTYWREVIASNKKEKARYESLLEKADNIENPEELKNKDTDKDGLSDYAEIYIYKTSPYLPDSDSDGFDDKTEIESGNNPLCPAGKDCGGLAPSKEGEEKPNLENLPPNFLGNTFGLSSPLGQGEVNPLNNNPLENIPPEVLRTYLRQAGLSEETLKQIDDATLKKLYEEVLKKEMAKEANTNTNTSLNLNSNTNTNPPATPSFSGPSFGNLFDLFTSGFSGAKIRELLKSQGIVDPQVLDQIDDKTLESLFFQALNQGFTGGLMPKL